MLGGCLWDIDFMPEIMQKIAYFVPQRWAMDARITSYNVCYTKLLRSFTGELKYWIAAITVPAFLCPMNIFPEYIMASLLSLFVFMLSVKLADSLYTLKKANERLRDKNDELIYRLNASSEYETQIRYLSQLEERNSLAQKIHDRVGHTIAGSIIQLEAAGLIRNNFV